MARIQNEAFKGIKGAVIGSYIVDYDENGVATVPTEVAQNVRKLNGFTVLDFFEEKKEPEATIPTPEQTELEVVIPTPEKVEGIGPEGAEEITPEKVEGTRNPITENGKAITRRKGRPKKASNDE